jgi:hypothetical protein
MREGRTQKGEGSSQKEEGRILVEKIKVEERR